MKFDLSFTPPQAEFIASPGQTITQAYQITNNSSDAIILTTSIESWQPSGTDGSIDLLPKKTSGLNFSLANADLALGQNFTLRSGQSRQLVLKIETPSSGSSGDNYLTFFVSKLDTGLTESENGAAISAKIGSNLLISTSASPNPASSGIIKQIHLRPVIKDVFLTPVTLTSQVENTSKFFFKTFGRLSLTKNGRLQKEFDLAPVNVLAGHQRDIPPLQINPPFWPGIYTATLTIDASSAAVPTATASFYVFPFSPLLAICFLAIIFYFFSHKRQ